MSNPLNQNFNGQQVKCNQLIANDILSTKAPTVANTQWFGIQPGIDSVAGTLTFARSGRIVTMVVGGFTQAVDTVSPTQIAAVDGVPDAFLPTTDIEGSFLFFLDGTAERGTYDIASNGGTITVGFGATLSPGDVVRFADTPITFIS